MGHRVRRGGQHRPGAERRREQRKRKKKKKKRGGEEQGRRRRRRGRERVVELSLLFFSSFSSAIAPRVEARCERVDATVERLWSATKTPRSKRKVALMKVDVEGFEPAALAGAARLFDAEEGDEVGDGEATTTDSDRKENKKTQPFPFSLLSRSSSKFGSLSDVVLEYSPGIPERNNAWDRLHEWPAMLLFLKSKGFVLANVPFGGGRKAGAASAGEDLLRGDWENPLPSFEEVTLENLAADVSDAEKAPSEDARVPPAAGAF